MQSVEKGKIFNIQRFSIHDGPGIRTTVFLKGCNLRCFWCHNPEAARMQSEIQFFPEKCISCGACVEVCPEDAQLLTGNIRVYLRDACQACFRCVEECFSGALYKVGKEVTVSDVLKVIEEDQGYYHFSEGGVTFSGGEPLLQKPFLKAILLACRVRGIHTAVDTAGNISWEALDDIRSLVDLFLFDVKAFDEEIHRQATGVGNQLIYNNLKRLSETGSPIWVRFPVIPGVNDSEEEVRQIAAFLGPLQNIQWVELLPFHTLGSEKYASLGLDYPAAGTIPPSKEKMAKLQALFSEKGLNVRVMS
jgi:pyruvate formate lyase activating enzyme